MPENRIIVSGSRTWRNREVIRDAMVKAYEEYPEHEPVLVYGKHWEGADDIAEDFAMEWGWHLDPYPADWSLYGPAAGPIRNTFMVRDGANRVIVCLNWCEKPDCPRLAERGPHYTHGSEHLWDYAKGAGIPVWEFFHG